MPVALKPPLENCHHLKDTISRLDQQLETMADCCSLFGYRAETEASSRAKQAEVGNLGRS